MNLYEMNKSDNYNSLSKNDTIILCLEKAIKNRNKDSIEHLVKKYINDFDPSFNNDQLIQWCSSRNLKSCVEILLNNENVDPSTNNNMCIAWACRKGYTEIFNMLYNHKKTDPTTSDNICLNWASKNEHYDIVKILAKDIRVQKSLNMLEKDIIDNYIK